jgi:phytoene/squalene synthetase
LLERRLDQVSRSFALCIPQLEPPFRDQVALAYLLFRVLDTVEDAAFEDQLLQQAQFERLRTFLRAMPTRGELARFVARFPSTLTDGERALLGDTAILFEDAYALDPAVRKVMFHAIDRMAIGMAAYARRPGELRLIDLDDVTRYCCFVAGLVGEMLTSLWSLANSAKPPRMQDAYHFGLFLQKVNILKDQEEDEGAGRFFIPDRTGLLASLRTDAHGALAYVTSLPAAERGYRTFCAWSLMIGLATIGLLDQPRVSRRAQTQELLAKIAAIACDNGALAKQFAELMPRLPDPAPWVRHPKPESAAWFRQMLRAPLDDEELRALGLATDVMLHAS